MVRPHHFGYNAQTATDNAFQQKYTTVSDVQAQALREFDGMVFALQSAGVAVHVLDYPNTTERLPDAVFPNNWLMTTNDGGLLTFPMRAANRRAELQQLPAVEALLTKENYIIDYVQHIGPTTATTEVLEGTGSLVLDHVNGIAYAALSQRTHKKAVERFARLHGYSTIQSFDSTDAKGKPIYHTNVLMAICEGLAVVCVECIPNAAEREAVLQSLSKHRTVLQITRAQMEQYYCGNILGLRTASGQQALLMSRRAHEGFTASQRELMQQHGKPVIVNVEDRKSVV